MAKLRTLWPGLNGLLLALLMLWQIPKMLDLEPLNRLTVPLAALCAFFGLGSALLDRLWKKPEVLLILAALAWMGGCSLLRGTLMNDLYTYVPCACAFLFCFTAPRLTDRDGLRRMARDVCFFWMLWMAVLSAAALYAAAAGVHLHQTAENRFIGINAGDSRLYIMDYCTNAAGNLLTGLLAAAGLIVCGRGKALRWVCACCAALMAAALSLTDARTSFIALGAGLGAAACCGMYHGLPGRKPAVRRSASFLSAAAVLMITYLFISGLTNMVGSAIADDGTVTHRAIGSGSFFTYRDDVWRGVLSFLRAEPSALLTGTGPSALMGRVMPYVVSEQANFDHPHCIWLQLLGAYGVPGLLLGLGFAGLFAVKAWKLLFGGSRALWERLLPVPAIAVFVCELCECLTLGRVNGPILILLFFLMGCTFAAADASPAIAGIPRTHSE